MIKLQNISKIYPLDGEDFYALKDVSLHIHKGEFVAICGASGSGKSTLLNIIGCLDKPSQGVYTLEDQVIDKCSDEKKAQIRNEKIGFVLQDFALVDGQSVLYNVMLPLLLGKEPFKTVHKRAKEVLGLVGVEDQAKKKASRLSGGQRQRVAIARALVNRPDIILADEPTGQLDSVTGVQIMELLKSLNEQGITIIMVTHDEKLAGYASRILRMVDGKLVREVKSLAE